MSDLEAHGFQMVNELIDLGCDCNVSFWFAANATEVTEIHVDHEDTCRLLDLAGRMS